MFLKFENLFINSLCLDFSGSKEYTLLNFLFVCFKNSSTVSPVYPPPSINISSSVKEIIYVQSNCCSLLFRGLNT